MINTGEQLSIEQVNELWNIVSPRLQGKTEQTAAAQPVTDAAQILRESIWKEWEAALNYKSLMRRQKSVLMSQIYDEQIQLVRRMLSVYFIASGQRLNEPSAKVSSYDGLAQIREQYIWEKRQAGIYQEYFRKRYYRELFFDCAKQKEANANKLYMIIESGII